MSKSFLDFIRQYGDTIPPSMLYKEDQDWHEWQQNLKDKLTELLGSLPIRADLAVEELGSEDAGSHQRISLMIKVNEFCDLPALLLVPKDLKEGEKRPGLIASHGHVAHGMESLAGLDHPEVNEEPYRAYGRDAVEAGYVVLCPAWWGWAGRDGHVEQTGTRDKCNVIQMAAQMYGLNVLAFHIQDGSAAIDALAARPEVRKDSIGIFGNSYGGRTSMWISLFDERIRACVASGCMNTFRERSLKLSSCGIQYLPGLLQYADVPELFSLIAPRPLQLMAGTQDGLLNEEDRQLIIDTVSKAYTLAKAEDNLDYAVHPEGHRIVWELAEAFFKKHLPI